MRRLLEDSGRYLTITISTACGSWAAVISAELGRDAVGMALVFTGTAALSLVVYAYAMSRGLA